MNCFRGMVRWLMWCLVRPNFCCAAGVFVAILLCFVAAAGIAAAPVTFQFAAEIIDVDVLFPAQLPFSVQSGDLINGRFTFEPIDANSTTSATNTVQTFGASFDLDSIILETSSYFLRVRNDSPVIDVTEQSTDDIFLGCLPISFASCYPEGVPSAGNIHWNFILPLFGPGSILDGADIPSDANVWNQFTPGYVSFAFQEVGVADVLRIVAKVNGFAVIPEPTSLGFVLPFLSLLVVSRWPLSRCCRSADVTKQ